MFRRRLHLDENPRESFFLWGSRQTGKSTLLRTRYPNAVYIDLLESDTFLSLTLQPYRLRALVQAAPPSSPIIIDEIQRVPSLLPEIQRLIDREQRVFAMSGSSARSLHRSGVHLLGGRAIRHELFGLTSAEMGDRFSLSHCLQYGPLPPHVLSEHPERLVSGYVDEYLRGEILSERLVRRLPVFADFLRIAALSDGTTPSFVSIARECGVSAPTVKHYFDLLVETLTGDFLPAFTAQPKRRVLHAPKFYFRNVGIVQSLLGRQHIARGTPEYGQALENWIHHELSAYRSYVNPSLQLSYWRLTSGAETDFILGPMKCAIEVKSSERINADHLRGIRELRKDHPTVRCILTYCGTTTEVTDDGIEILPVTTFLDRLWGGHITS